MQQAQGVRAVARPFMPGQIVGRHQGSIGHEASVSRAVRTSSGDHQHEFADFTVGIVRHQSGRQPQVVRIQPFTVQAAPRGDGQRPARGPTAGWARPVQGRLLLRPSRSRAALRVSPAATPPPVRLSSLSGSTDERAWCPCRRRGRQDQTVDVAARLCRPARKAAQLEARAGTAVQIVER